MLDFHPILTTAEGNAGLTRILATAEDNLVFPPYSVSNFGVTAIPMAFLRNDYLDYRLKDDKFWVSNPGRGRNSSRFQRNETSSEAHPASYTMDIAGLFSRG
jgi:hypothetical protein